MVAVPSPALQFHAWTPKIGAICTSPCSGGLTCPFAPMIWQPGCPPCSRRRYSSCQLRKLVAKPGKSSISFRRETSRRSSRTGDSFPTGRSSSRCDTCGPRTEHGQQPAPAFGRGPLFTAEKAPLPARAGEGRNASSFRPMLCGVKNRRLKSPRASPSVAGPSSAACCVDRKPPSSASCTTILIFIIRSPHRIVSRTPAKFKSC